jgi:predicted exporter
MTPLDPEAIETAARAMAKSNGGRWMHYVDIVSAVVAALLTSGWEIKRKDDASALERMGERDE